MLAALTIALGCAACTDRHPALAEPEPEMELVGMLQCTVDVRTLHMTCTEATPSTPGISPALFGTNQVKLASSNVAHDANTGIFGMDVTAQNLLSYSIGTPDGTARAGLKVFFQTGPTASYYTLGDTGTVRVHNPTGYQNFTAAQQPYFHYDTILHPQEVAEPQRWEFSVPATVKSFGFTVRVFTATQRENRVLMEAPRSRPAWFGDPARSVDCMPHLVGPCLKDVIVVEFRNEASREERQSAVDLVRGRVIGGSLGAYYVALPSVDSLHVERLIGAINQLDQLPQVEYVSAYSTLAPSPDYLTPYDTAGWREWKLNPDSADEQNWSFERVAAPYAWGCSVGDSTRIGIVDQGFHPIRDLTRNAGSFPASMFPVSLDHGTSVAAVAAAYGNDSTGVTGMMWRARLGLYEVGGTGTDFQGVWEKVAEARRDGARVINVSIGIRWSTAGVPDPKNPTPQQQTAMTNLSRAHYRGLKRALEDTAGVTSATSRPLVVFSAGNENMDARWGPGRVAADSTPPDGRWEVLVVGASTLANGRWSESNYGDVVDLMAPGHDVYVPSGTGAIKVVSGTSFAAPLVSGAAGLLFSFDPRLTAPQVKQMLLDGAGRGNRSAGGIPLLNVRESLILAGRRPTAPLCGNRMWIDETGMYAQRDTSSATGERLFSVTRSPSGSYYFDALHGGKEIQVQAGGRVLAKWSPKGWTTQPTTWRWDIPTANGTFRSGNGQSHSGDTTFYTTRNVVGAETVFGLRLEINGVDKALSETIRRPHRNGPPVCLSMLDSIRTSVLQPIVDEPILLEQYQIWRAQVDSSGGCMRNGPPAEVLTSDRWYAYHPEGREAYVFVSEQVGAAGVGAWIPCTTEHSLYFFDPYVGMHRTWPFRVEGRCRNVDTVRETAAPVIYRVRLSTETATPYAFTGAPVTRGEIIYAGFSEDGREVLWQLRDVTSRHRQQWTQGYGGVWTLSPTISVEYTVTCRTEFRNFRTGATTLEPPTTCASSTGIAADRHAARG